MLTGVTLWDLYGVNRNRPDRDVVVRSPISILSRGLRMRSLTNGHYDTADLAHLIRRLRPDVVHAMEFQHAGYLTLDAYRLLSEGEQPPLIVSNYGSDISLLASSPSTSSESVSCWRRPTSTTANARATSRSGVT